MTFVLKMKKNHDISFGKHNQRVVATLESLLRYKRQSFFKNCRKQKFERRYRHSYCKLFHGWPYFDLITVCRIFENPASIKIYINYLMKSVQLNITMVLLIFTK